MLKIRDVGDKTLKMLQTSVNCRQNLSRVYQWCQEWLIFGAYDVGKSLLVNSFYIHGVVCGVGVFTDTFYYWTWDYLKCVRLLDGINSRDLTSRDYRLNALNFIFECFRVLGYSIGVTGDPIIPFGSLNELQIRSVFVQTYQKSPKISQMKIGTGIDIRHNRISALIIFYGFH